MGLIRKTLYLSTGGLVAPNSKKRRLAMQQLAALQGATDEEIRQRGGRNDYDGFFGFQPASVAAREREARQRQGPQAEKRYRPCAACGAPVRQVAGRYWDERDNEHRCAVSASRQAFSPCPDCGAEIRLLGGELWLERDLTVHRVEGEPGRGTCPGAGASLPPQPGAPAEQQFVPCPACGSEVRLLAGRYWMQRDGNVHKCSTGASGPPPSA